MRAYLFAGRARNALLILQQMAQDDAKIASTALVTVQTTGRGAQALALRGKFITSMGSDASEWPSSRLARLQAISVRLVARYLYMCLALRSFYISTSFTAHPNFLVSKIIFH